MPRPPATAPSTRQRGFSLLELLVVVVILSVITGTVALNYFRSDEQKMADFAVDLRDQLVAVRDTAILQGRPYVVVFKQHEYLVFELSREQKLVPAIDGPIAAHQRLPDGLRFATLTLPHTLGEDTRGILIDSTGMLPAFELNISDSDQSIALTNDTEQGLRIVTTATR